ncbi:helix-turn-helix domain-containing protein [Mycobacteroides abscessus]|uniref:helix-turn-helix domain-containing protein n=1 Tax=Mycobacteroides abscessus TaxID=36809 RepID=UPI002102B3C9|nr:helix-turn-helix domain-containing protein [Mycobacteroides abscessus]
MSATATLPRYLTPDEVSTECFGGAVAPGRILNLTKSQGLPSHRVGRRQMFIADEVDAWVRSRDADGGALTAAPPPGNPAPVDPAWVAAVVAQFSANDLRRAGELLLALSRADVQTDGGT